MSNKPNSDARRRDTSQSLQAVEFYWRPGCGFCKMLERSLTKAGIPMDKRNIWDDAGHAATVRKHANGNETVPTVVIAGTALVNPSSNEVISTLAAKAPHLVPDTWQAPEPGRVARAARRLLGG